jgi:hypothetical protein
MTGLDAFTAAERREIADQLGLIVMYFTVEASRARREREIWKDRALELEAIVTRYRSGVLTTDLAVGS